MSQTSTESHPEAPEPAQSPASLASRLRMDSLGPRHRRWLIAIVAVAFTVRLGWAAYATQEPISPFVSGDPFLYFQYGQELAAGDGYNNFLTGEPTAYYPIGYPGILAGLFWIIQHTPIPDDLDVAGSLLNVVLGTLSVGLVFLIGSRLFRPAVALVGAGIVAVFPNLVFYVATMQLETVFIFLCLLAVAVLVTHDWSGGPPGRTRLVAFGLVLGVCSLVRPFCLPFLAGVVLAVVVGGYGWRRAVTAVGWALLPVVAVVAPWTVRNYVVFDTLVLFSSNMGDGLCIDRSLDATGGFRFTSHEGCAPVPEGPVEDFPREFEVEQNQKNTRRALEFIREHPGKEVELWFRRAGHMMANDHDGLVAVEAGDQRPFLGDRLRTVLSRTADWYFYVTIGLAVLGVPSFLRTPRRPERVLVLTAMVTLFLVPLTLWGNTRFHMPFLPFAAIAAAVTLSWLWGHARPRASVKPAS